MAISPIVITFFLSGLALLGLGLYLCRRIPTSAKYQARRERRSFGHFFMFLSILPIALGGVTQYFSGNGSDADAANGNADQQLMVVVKKKPTGPISPYSFPPVPAEGRVSDLLKQAIGRLELNQTDEAMSKVNAALEADPKNWAVYYVRGNIYAVNHEWDKAEKDYQTALQMNGHDSSIQYNLADIEFLQKKYDLARPGFAALEHDDEIGDLCTYKVFLCDLYGAHLDTAGQDLDALNQIGSNASYYFANAAWSLYHQKLNEAQGWLSSAAKIYSPSKFKRYTASLSVLGYPEKMDQYSASNPPPLVSPDTTSVSK